MLPFTVVSPVWFVFLSKSFYSSSSFSWCLGFICPLSPAVICHIFHMAWAPGTFLGRLPSPVRQEQEISKAQHFRKQRNECREGSEGKPWPKPQIWRRMGQEVGGWLEGRAKLLLLEDVSAEHEKVERWSVSGEKKWVEDGAMSRKDKAWDWEQEIAQSPCQEETEAKFQCHQHPSHADIPTLPPLSVTASVSCSHSQWNPTGLHQGMAMELWHFHCAVKSTNCICLTV